MRLLLLGYMLLLRPTTVAALERGLLRLKRGRFHRDTLNEKSDIVSSAINGLLARAPNHLKRQARDRSLVDRNVFFRAILADKQAWDKSMSMSLSQAPSPQQPSSPPQSTSSSSPSISSSPTRNLAPTATPEKTSIVPTASQAPTTYVQPSSVPTATPPPSISQSPSTSDQPSAVPTVTHEPSLLLSNVPSLIPRSEPTSTLIQEKVVFGCTPEGIVNLVQPPFEALTAISFKVGYAVESLAPPVEYIEDLERQILATAVAGALQCNTGGPYIGNDVPVVFGRATGSGSRRTVLVNTVESGELCEASVSMCTVLETDFQVVVNEDLDPEVAAFLGYFFLREQMDGGAFVDAISIIDRCEYLSPLPLLPPIVDDADDKNPDSVQGVAASERVTVRPWTLGTASAMSAGGLIALVAWLRNRRIRNRRHMELVEDMSVGSPSQV